MLRVPEHDTDPEGTGVVGRNNPPLRLSKRCQCDGWVLGRKLLNTDLSQPYPGPFDTIPDGLPVSHRQESQEASLYKSPRVDLLRQGKRDVRTRKRYLLTASLGKGGRKQPFSCCRQLSVQRQQKHAGLFHAMDGADTAVYGWHQIHKLPLG